MRHRRQRTNRASETHPGLFPSVARGLRRLAAMPPARKALLAQIGGWNMVWLLGRGGLLPAGAWPLVLIQAAAAATLAAALRSARWWLPIHLAFTPLALAARALALPPGAWLAAFIALALIYWSSFRTQAPLFLTNRPTATAVAALLPPGPAAALDIGCGIGTLLAALAPRRADLRLTGIETAPVPFALAFLRTRKHSGVTVVRGDFFAYSWAEYDLVYAFLSPAPMRAVWEKARREMRPGSLFVSNSFTVPGREPECIVEVADRRRTRLLVFVIPALPAFAVDPPASRRAPAVRPARTPSEANRPPLFQPSSPPSATDPPGGVAQAARIERRKPESAPPEPNPHLPRHAPCRQRPRPQHTTPAPHTRLR